MAGSAAAQDTITANILVALRRHLRAGGPCKVFVNDMNVRLAITGEALFYYPDVVVMCHPVGAKDHFTRFPTVIFEVLSDSTEITDRREKLMNYRQCDSLEEYVLVDQSRREVTLHRRGDDRRNVGRGQTGIVRRAVHGDIPSDCDQPRAEGIRSYAYDG